MLSATPPGRVEYPDLESNQDLDLRRVPCAPLHYRDMEPTTGLAPASSGLQNRRLAIRPRRQVRLRPEGRKRSHIYFSSSTFQYASLTNFDQLSIRTSWNA
jgi:hypothetical protein